MEDGHICVALVCACVFLLCGNWGRATASQLTQGTTPWLAGQLATHPYFSQQTSINSSRS